MKLHYFYSGRAAQLAIITFNGVVQKNCIQVDDVKGFIIVREIVNGVATGKLISHHGKVTIEIPAHGTKAAYKTKETAT